MIEELLHISCNRQRLNGQEREEKARPAIRQHLGVSDLCWASCWRLLVYFQIFCSFNWYLFLCLYLFSNSNLEFNSPGCSHRPTQHLLCETHIAASSTTFKLIGLSLPGGVWFLAFYQGPYICRQCCFVLILAVVELCVVFVDPWFDEAL